MGFPISRLVISRLTILLSGLFLEAPIIATHPLKMDGPNRLSLFQELKCPDLLDLENSDNPNVDIPMD
jgi:hypothetical protein